MKWFAFLSIVGVFGLAAANDAKSATINLLSNPGFETGDFSGWTLGGNSLAAGVQADGTSISGVSSFFSPTFQNVRSGNFAANALVLNGGASSPSGTIELLSLTQSVNVLAGESYDVSFFLGADAANSSYGVRVVGDTRIQIIANGQELLPDGFRIMGAGSGPSDFISYSGTYNSTATESIDVMFQITGSGTGRAGFSFDDFQVFGEAEGPVVPEPTSMALFGMMTALGFGVGFRRRRNGGEIEELA